MILARLRRHRWLVLLVSMLTITVSYTVLLLRSAVGEPELLTFVDDAACDLEWARAQLDGRIALHGHWSNTLGTTHPGPWYLWLLAVGGWLGQRFSAGFDVGASAALAVAGIALVSASAWAAGRTYRSARMAWAILAAGLLVAASTHWRGLDTGTAPAFGMHPWAGALIPWAVGSVVMSLWCLSGTWTYRGAYAIAAGGFAASLYLPAALLAVPAAALGAAVAARGDLRGRLAALAASVLWLPILIRAVTEGPEALLPQDVQVDVYGQGLQLSEGVKALASTMGGAPDWLAAALWSLLALLGVAWLVASARKGRSVYHPGLLVVLVAVAAAQHLLVWPTPLNRYQTNWASVALAFLVAGLAWRWMPRKMFIPASTLAVTAALLGGALPVTPERAVLADRALTAQVLASFDRLGVSRGESVGVIVDGKVWNSGQAVVHHAVGAGIKVCTIGRRDLQPLECTERPARVLVVSSEPPGEAFRGTAIGYGAEFWMRMAEPGEDLPSPEPTGLHPQQPTHEGPGQHW